MKKPWVQVVREAEAELKAIYQKEISHPFHLDDRMFFYVQMLAENGLLNKGARLVDLGSGVDAFGPVLQKIGLQVTLIDTFSSRAEWYRRIQGDAGYEREIKVVGLFKQLGINVVDHDLAGGKIPLPDQSLDIVASFHMIEHFHNSPKPLFREISRVLVPRGHLVLAMPNAVNLRKRLWVLFGRNNFAPLDEWYNQGDPVFRGHVREPVVADLRHMMEWNRFKVLSTPGRNFTGRRSRALSFLPEKLKNGLVVGMEGILNAFPSICSDIHAVGQKEE